MTPAVMQLIPCLLVGVAMYALAHKPAWARQFKSWRTWITVVAVIGAILVVMNPEFFALGILGDSALFDLLVLAISLQLQTILTRIGDHVASAFVRVLKFYRWRFYVTGAVLLLTFEISVEAIHKAVDRMSG